MSSGWPSRQQFNRLLSLSNEILGTATTGTALSASRFLAISGACEALLGWTPEQLIGHTCSSFVHPDDVERTRREADVARLADSEAVNIENRFRTVSGDYCQLRWTVFLDDDRYLFIARKIARRKTRDHSGTAAAESAVVSTAPRSHGDSASLLAAIVDSSVDAIIGKSLQGIVTHWNLGAERMYGYPASEVIGRHISLLFPAGRSDQLNNALGRIANGGGPEQHDVRRIRKDGTELDVSVTIAPITDVNGSVIGAAAVDRDITKRLSLERERRALDARLNQSDRLESLGRLAGGIAHDFNNMLAVISSYATFVGRELDDQESARTDLEQIHAATERASGLTRQLLAFARREILQPQILSLNDVVSGLEPLLRRTLGEQIELAIELEPRLRHVEADPGQLEQILINLTMNARDAMPRGGRITIRTENFDVDTTNAVSQPAVAHGHYVRLLVSDSGTGIEASVLEHVFEPFFTTKPLGEGTGLGLPIVFGIARQTGGDVQMRSAVGLGTTCQVLLPASELPIRNPRGASTAHLLGGVETILLVEDEDAMREVTARILTRGGYTVQTSASGPGAIKLFSKAPSAIDLLLTDVIMPTMVGEDLASHLRTLRPELRVLYISGYAQPILGTRLSKGAKLLEKPFSEQELLAKVREVLDESLPPT